MNIVGWLLAGYIGLGIIMGLVCRCLTVHLLNYIYRCYPEEGKVIRAYAWQRYPGSMFDKAVKALIAKHGAEDAELAQRARKMRRGAMCFSVWFSVCLLGIGIALVFHLVYSG
jgi:hypothetical protein